MAIKINLQGTAIPVEIGELKFEVDVTDAGYQKTFQQLLHLQEEAIALITQAATVDEASTAMFKHKLHTLIQEAYDDLLGAGAFTAVYAQTPNITYVTKYLTEIIAGIQKQLEHWS